MDRITSRQNALVQRFRALHEGDPDRKLMLLDGAHLVREALASGVHLEAVALTDRVASGSLADLAAELGRRSVRVVLIDSAVLAAVSPVRQPSGIVAIAAQPSAAADRVLLQRPALVLTLSGVQDPGNVGAIVRTAEGCGATGLIVTAGTSDPFSWKALRGGMGSTFRLPIASVVSPDDAVRLARSSGLRVIAATARGGTPLPACNLRGDCAILLGSEGPGLPAAIVEAADERMTIPMRAPVESLNVAIAAALVVYEAARQRTAPPTRAGRTNVAV